MVQIYSKATNVLIWLGNETNAAATAFKCLEWISTMLPDQYWQSSAGSETDQIAHIFDENILSILDEMACFDTIRLISSKQLDYHLECVATILRNPYWSRIWILQEVVMAQFATVLCGSLSMEWNRFSSCAKILMGLCHTTVQKDPFTEHDAVFPPNSQSSWFRMKAEGPVFCFPELTGDEIRTNHAQSLIPTTLTKQLMYMTSLRKRRLRSHSLRMSALLSATLEYKSTDVRDKIYALLGMADQSEFSTPIMADYTHSYPKVCTKLAIKFLLRRMDLAILEDLEDPVARIEREIPPRHIHLPSWVPDFGYMSSISSLDCQNWKEAEDVAFDDLSVLVESNVWGTSELRNPGRRAFNASAHPCSRFPYTFSPDFKIFNIPGVEFDTVETCTQFHDDSSESTRICLRSWQRLVKAMLHDEYPRGGTYREAYWRTTLCNIYWPETIHGPFCELPSVISDDIHIPPTSEEEEQRLIDLVCSGWEEVTAQMSYRQMFLTRSGLTGLGPASMRPGDTLAVLMGGRVPIVLRQTSDCFKHDRTKSGIYYQVVGER